MPTHPFHFLLLLAAALAAGAINSAAGGGTLLTFPALMAVLGPGGSVLANGTSTVALVPGSLSAFWGYRKEMGSSRRDLLALGLPSLLGGAVGAYLATHIGAAIFSRLVPWLIFTATFLFLAQEPVRRWIDRDSPPAPNSGGAREQTEVGSVGVWPPPMASANDTAQEMEIASTPAPPELGAGGLVFQFFVAIYGGFFGAGIGIMMLAALGFLGQTNIHRMNGLKNFAAVCINGVGALTFIFYRQVNWPLALPMAVAAVVGGYGGAGLARRVGQENVRRLVIAIGLLFGAYTLWEQLKHG